MIMVLIILAINIVYVSFFTIRMILTLKGQKFLAATLSSIEVIIYIIGLGLVLDNINNIQNLIAYAIGYALGVLLGSKIEEKLALGYVTVKVITNHNDEKLPNKLRDHGFGVTSWLGEGRDGHRLMLEILTKRNRQKELYNHIIAHDSRAFIISHEPQHFHGGFWVRGMRHQDKPQRIVHQEDNLPGVTEKTIQEVIAKTEEPQD